MDKVLFKTVHGSHLYGLESENSDRDFYTVVLRERRGRKYKYAKQTVTGDVDNMTVDVGTWLLMCEKSVPQALEAMFSPKPLVDELSALRNSYRVGGTMRDTYLRTMENFVQSGDDKRKRHALRLYLNLKQASRYGRFNPRLTAHQRWWVDSVATRFSDESVLGLVTSNKHY
jgi:hypothetical protein